MEKYEKSKEKMDFVKSVGIILFQLAKEFPSVFVTLKVKTNQLKDFTRDDFDYLKEAYLKAETKEQQDAATKALNYIGFL